MQCTKEKAYAKINLFLDVLSKRVDGFHDIKSVMHTVSLFDELSVSLTPSRTASVHMTIEGGGYLPTDSRNLAVRAANLFLDTLGLSLNVTIHLKKNIPVAAGLAGGSSDAAAVLRALNRLLKRPLTKSVLMKLALNLGSDVPFCLNGGCALCEGRGELMTPMPSAELHLVIAISDEHISAADAYTSLDAYRENVKDCSAAADKSFDLLNRYLNGGEINRDMLFNAFEFAILPSCPGAVQIKEKMLALGAISALMSGSGPSVYGLFCDADSANAARDELLRLGYFAAAVTTV